MSQAELIILKIFDDAIGDAASRETALATMESLELMDALLDVEKQLGVKFADKDFSSMRSVGDVIDRTEALLHDQVPS
jgi:acyl carrier protein